MARTPSTMLALGTTAPDFALLEPTTGNRVSLADCLDGQRGLMVVFICNHCPYVKHIAEQLAAYADHYREQGIGVVAINSNDADNYPDDGPQQMAAEVAARGYRFPYLYDADQAVAKAYQAACTPDFYLFDGEGKLYYRGQFDDARPHNDVAVSGCDLRAATDTLLAGAAAPAEQKPSLGCNIKWKPGNEPDYFG